MGLGAEVQASFGPKPTGALGDESLNIAAIGGGASFGKVITSLANAGASMAPSGMGAAAGGAGAHEGWFRGTFSSESLLAGTENVRTTWQAAPRAPNTAPQRYGETERVDAGEAAPWKELGRPGAPSGGVRSFLSGAGAIPTAITIGGKTGSKVLVTTPNGPGVLLGKQGTTEWTGTATKDTIESSRVSLKDRDRVGGIWRTATETQTAQGTSAIASSPADGVSLGTMAAPLQPGSPPVNLPPPVTGLLGESDKEPDGRIASLVQGINDARRGSADSESTAPVSVATISGTDTHGAEPGPTHTTQSLADGLATKTADSSAVAAIKTEDGSLDGDREDSAALLNAAPSGTTSLSSSAPKVIGTMHPSPISGESTAASGTLFSHGAAGAASGAQRGTVAEFQRSDNQGAELESGDERTPLARIAHGDGSAAVNAAPSTKQEHAIVAGQTFAIETPVMVRDQAGAHGAPASVLATGNNPTGAGGEQEAFSALDSGSTAGSPRWVHTPSGQAEAGFEDPTLGWIGVRAELGGGGLHASLVPGSAEAARVLGSHLEGLSTYLSENHTQVSTLTLATAGGSGGQAASDQHMGQSMNQAMQQGASQRGNKVASSAQVAAAIPNGSHGINNSAAGEVDAPAYARDGRGTHVSVMA